MTNFKIPERGIDPVGSLIPAIDVGTVRKPVNRELYQSSAVYDPNMNQIRVKWTSRNMGQVLKPTAETDGKNITVRLSAGYPGSSGGLRVSIPSMEDHNDVIGQLPTLAPGGTITVLDGDFELTKYTRPA